MKNDCEEAQNRRDAVVPDRNIVQMESRIEEVGGCRTLGKKLR